MSQSAISCIGCKHALADTALFCPHCGRPKLRDMASDALLGQLLGERFQIQTRIGFGGSGVVYRAEHVTLRRKVAIKVLHEELSRDELAIERFRREATTVTAIDNEHIVDIYDFGRAPDGRLYLAMELLEGESLDAVLARERRLSVERTADILIQVGQALMEAHAIGYVHRDVRPRNIYLAVRHGQPHFVKLLDFGLAKLVENDASASSTKLGMRFGDPRYMSPEQASGDRIDRRSDMYQLGCVAYEMLTGTPPFVGDRVFEILAKQAVEIPKPLPSRRPDVPLWMEAACAKLLAKDPMHRFVTATRMIEALQRGLATGEVMTDDDARQREAVLPPSVSRVMQRMGVPEAYVARSEVVHQRPVLAADAPVPTDERVLTTAPQVGAETVATAAEPSPVSTSAAITGGTSRTSKDAASAPQSPQTGESARWYEEGDRASHEAELAAGERARKLISPSATDVVHWSTAPSSRRPVWIVAGALAVTAGIFIVIKALQSSPTTSTPRASAVVALAQDAAPPPKLAVAADANIDNPGSADMRSAAVTGVRKGIDAPLPSVVPPPSTSASSSAELRATAAPQDKRLDRSERTAKAKVTSGAQRPPPLPPSPPIRTVPALSEPLPRPAPSVPEPNGGVSGATGPLDPYGDDPTNAQGTEVRGQSEWDELMRVAEIALGQRRFVEAIAPLRRAAQLVPTSTRVFTLLGEAHAGSGQFGAAAEAFKRALQLDPDNARARLGYEQAASRVPPPTDE